MKAIRLHGPGDLRLDEIEEPVPGPADVVVQVAACGICGSDLSYLRTGGVSAPVVDPIGLGHELSGTIAAVGDSVQKLAPGMRVIVNPMGGGNAIGNGSREGAFAPRLLVRNAAVGDGIHPIPDSLSFEKGRACGTAFGLPACGEPSGRASGIEGRRVRRGLHRTRHRPVPRTARYRGPGCRRRIRSAAGSRTGARSKRDDQPGSR